MSTDRMIKMKPEFRKKSELLMNDDSLYTIPIQTLGLSANTIALLGRVGITSVGDCVDFYQRGSAATIQVPYGLIDAFFAEVVPRLRELGYIPDEEDNDL